ncbi:unnamed protein product [Effrenium voratum]|uniref:C3H1-type domain-containing protein n=1 Tax=Effrenium voratum TaxID=2562239 RepID=A0AA36IJC1_9DINO|nr:unnamed protein product [Effrenium voratum]
MRTAPFVPMPRKRPGEQDKGTELVLRDESKVRKTSSWMRQTESKQWEVVLDEDRKRSLDAWVLLVLDNPGASVAGTLIQQEDQDGQLSVLADIFRAKATATLRARASALLAYMRWGRAEHGRTFTLFPVKEVVVYEYLCFLRDTRSPPTKAERFVQALAFCKGTLQADVDNVLASSRIKGATIPIQGHRVVRKKRPLTVAQVADLERRASTDESATGVFCGYLCFLVHGRLRWGPDGAGSLEAGLYYHKTANRQKSVIRRLLPAACSLPGVSGLPWAQTWLQNRAKHGLRAKKGCPMMPAPLASGKWDSIPLGTAEAIVWMKEVLQDAQGDVGTHSCKATALSWMAKANVDRHIRRLGGYHVAPGDRSMTEYSRDAQSPVLHALSGLYLAIRGGLFSPDASRSGRWNGYHNLEDAVKVLAAAPSLPVDGEPTGEGDSSGDSSGKSTSSSSSEGEEVDDEVVRADQAMAVLAAPAQLEQEDMAFYLLNVKSQVAHIPRPGTYGDEDGEMEVSKCGLIASAGFRKVDLFPEQIMRCRAVGLTAEAVTKLAEKGWNTYATFAFCVPSLPGSSEAAETLFVTRVIEPVLGDPDHADGPKLRRLAFESFTMNAADLKRRVESNEGDAPKKLPALEIAHRLDAIRDKVKPLLIERQLEPSHALLNAVNQSVEEIQGLTEANQFKSWKPDKNGVIHEVSQEPALKAELATELDLQNALRRRGIAYEAAAAMSFVSHEKLVARLFEELQRPAQDGFSKVTMTQLCLADREFHEKLADKTRAGLAPGPLGELPLDQFVDEVLRLPSFQWVLMQRPAQKASSTLSKGKPPAQQKPVAAPPKQVVKPQKRRGASKGKSGSKGSRFPMPEKLRGGTPTDESGNSICFAFNLGQCVDENCPRKHVCCYPGCFSKAHGFLQHS